MTAEFNPTLRPPISDALVSVVLPVYNELPLLAELCQRLRMTLKACRTTFEIIFVDDGSGDGSATLLDRLARQFEEVRVVHLARNFGQQSAIQAGLERARGDAVVVMDANLRDPPEAIGQMLACWQEGYDAVYAVRIPRDGALWKRALRHMVYRLTSNDETGVPAYAGNFGLIDARLAEQIIALKENDPSLPTLRHWLGFKQIGIPVHRARRHAGGIRRRLRAISRFTRVALYSAAPPTLFTWLGWMALGIVMYVGGYAAYCQVFTEGPVAGWSLQLILVSLFVGLNALGIGMLGHYLLRIYDQVRGRPLYVVDRTVNFAAAEIREAELSAAALHDDPAAAHTNALNLDQLDPLEIEDNWDDTYQHLLNDAQGLLELGALARSEADDLADRECRQSTTTTGISDIVAPNAEAPAAEEPRVIKLSELRQ